MAAASATAGCSSRALAPAPARTPRTAEKDAARLQRPQCRDIELRHAPEQAEHPLSGVQVQLPQQVRKAACGLREVAVAEIALVAVRADPAQRGLVGEAVEKVPVQCLEGDIEPAAR